MSCKMATTVEWTPKGARRDLPENTPPEVIVAAYDDLVQRARDVVTFLRLVRGRGDNPPDEDAPVALSIEGQEVVLRWIEVTYDCHSTEVERFSHVLLVWGQPTLDRWKESVTKEEKRKQDERAAARAAEEESQLVGLRRKARKLYAYQEAVERFELNLSLPHVTKEDALTILRRELAGLRPEPRPVF